jgi:uncharacterized protein YuzE
MRILIQRDRANDQAYLGLQPDRAGQRGAVKKTVRVTDDIAVDLDGRGRLVGIDIANASRVLGAETFTGDLSTDELLGVAEAAKLCSVKKPNFIRDYASRPDFPHPVVELASGRIWWRSEIERYLNRPSSTHTAGSGHPTVYQALTSFLAADELGFRHNALTYFNSSFFSSHAHRLPSIEEITVRSIEEDKQLTARAQAGDVELYVEAAWGLRDKYSSALESYLLGALPVDGSLTVRDVYKRTWVEALQRIQMGEFDPLTSGSFSRWLLTLANGVLRTQGVKAEPAAADDPHSDFLEEMVQATRYQEAVEQHERRAAQLQTEHLVLEYLSNLSSDEISQFLSSTIKRAADPREVFEAQRQMERRLREVARRLL